MQEKIEIKITNASVSDSGYGLRINGKSLEDIITLVLNASDDPFDSKCCNITITLEPMPKTEYSVLCEDERLLFNSFSEMEAKYGKNG